MKMKYLKKRRAQKIVLQTVRSAELAHENCYCIHQQVIDQAIDQWRERLQACVNTWSDLFLLCFAFISN